MTQKPSDVTLWLLPVIRPENDHATNVRGFLQIRRENPLNKSQLPRSFLLQTS